MQGSAQCTKVRKLKLLDTERKQTLNRTITGKPSSAHTKVLKQANVHIPPEPKPQKALGMKGLIPSPQVGRLSQLRKPRVSDQEAYKSFSSESSHRFQLVNVLSERRSHPLSCRTNHNTRGMMIHLSTKGKRIWTNTQIFPITSLWFFVCQY